MQYMTRWITETEIALMKQMLKQYLLWHSFEDNNHWTKCEQKRSIRLLIDGWSGELKMTRSTDHWSIYLILNWIVEWIERRLGKAFYRLAVARTKTTHRFCSSSRASSWRSSSVKLSLLLSFTFSLLLSLGLALPLELGDSLLVCEVFRWDIIPIGNRSDTRLSDA